jgi:hypothetical protein
MRVLSEKFPGSGAATAAIFVPPWEGVMQDIRILVLDLYMGHQEQDGYQNSIMFLLPELVGRRKTYPVYRVIQNE